MDDKIARSIGRRSTDGFWRWLAMFLAGVITSAAGGGFWLAQRLDEVNNVTRQVTELRVEIKDMKTQQVAQSKETGDQMRQLQLDVNTVKVKLEDRQPSRARMPVTTWPGAMGWRVK